MREYQLELSDWYFLLLGQGPVSHYEVSQQRNEVL